MAAPERGEIVACGLASGDASSVTNFTVALSSDMRTNKNAQPDDAADCPRAGYEAEESGEAWVPWVLWKFL